MSVDGEALIAFNTGHDVAWYVQLRVEAGRARATGGCGVSIYVLLHRSGKMEC